MRKKINYIALIIIATFLVIQGLTSAATHSSTTEAGYLATITDKNNLTYVHFAVSKPGTTPDSYAECGLRNTLFDIYAGELVIHGYAVPNSGYWSASRSTGHPQLQYCYAYVNPPGAGNFHVRYMNCGQRIVDEF